ncbi:MAG: flippase-like domain-containing protein [Bacteroidia bacterium]|nr:flippase-like domain-containing protein [Bacteroidia bacterium]
MSRNKKYSWLSPVLFILLGGGLFYWVAQKFDITQAVEIIKHGEYWNIIPVILVSFLSYSLRVQRWRMLMKAGGNPSSFANGLMALSIGYTVNYALPRVGEVTRSLIIWRKEKTPFELTLGAVVTERVVDIMMLFITCTAALLLQFDRLRQFIQTFIWLPLTGRAGMPAKGWWLIAIALAVLSIIGLLVRRFFQSDKVHHWLYSFLKGLLSIKKVSPFRYFIFYTLGIWSCYFLMTYLWTFSFPQSAFIGPLAAFVVMVTGSIGRSIPVQGGGMGVYHSLVTPAFMLYGVTEPVAFALAIIIHGAQALFTCCMGLVCYLWLSIQELKH